MCEVRTFEGSESYSKYDPNKQILEITQHGCYSIDCKGDPQSKGNYACTCWGDMCHVKVMYNNTWRSFMIDLGSKSKEDHETLDKILKCEDIDFAVLSHWHEDHYAGMEYDKFKCYLIYCGRPGNITQNNWTLKNRTKIKDEIKYVFGKGNQIPPKKIIDGVIEYFPIRVDNDIFISNSVKLRLLMPSGLKDTIKDENLLSLTSIISVHDDEKTLFNFISLGDSTDEKYLPSRVKDYKYDVVKLPHHGCHKGVDICNHIKDPLLKSTLYIMSGFGGEKSEYSIECLSKKNHVYIVMHEDGYEKIADKNALRMIQDVYRKKNKNKNIHIVTSIKICVDSLGNWTAIPAHHAKGFGLHVSTVSK